MSDVADQVQHCLYHQRKIAFNIPSCPRCGEEMLWDVECTYFRCPIGHIAVPAWKTEEDRGCPYPHLHHG